MFFLTCSTRASIVFLNRWPSTLADGRKIFCPDSCTSCQPLDPSQSCLSYFLFAFPGVPMISSRCIPKIFECHPAVLLEMLQPHASQLFIRHGLLQRVRKQSLRLYSRVPFQCFFQILDEVRALMKKRCAQNSHIVLGLMHLVIHHARNDAKPFLQVSESHAWSV